MTLEPKAPVIHVSKAASATLSPTTITTSLNNTAAIDPRKVLRVIDYGHPIFTERAVAAQQRHREINGARRTYFCGAYWRYGFHEDGVVSSIQALRHFDEDQHGVSHDALQERYLRRSA